MECSFVNAVSEILHESAGITLGDLWAAQLPRKDSDDSPKGRALQPRQQVCIELALRLRRGHAARSVL